MRNPLDCKIAFAGPLALGLSLMVGPALAQEAGEATEAQMASQTREPTVLVCKTFAVTGTRIEREYCLTEDDWDDIREHSQETFQRLLGIGTET
jgi:hypothetical protein